jgi:hypothetical protein
MTKERIMAVGSLIYSSPLFKPFKYSMMSGQFGVLSTKSTGTSTNSASTNLRSIRMLPRTCNLITLYDIVIAQIGGITEVTEDHGCWLLSR